MKTREVSTIIFYTKDHKIMMQDRTSIRKFGEEWGFFGGGIENNETPAEALVREIKEELDYDIQDFEFLGRVEANLVYAMSGEPIHIIANVFIKLIDEDTSQFTVREGDGAHFYTMGQARRLNFIKSLDNQKLDLLKNFFEKQ